MHLISLEYLLTRCCCRFLDLIKCTVVVILVAALAISLCWAAVAGAEEKVVHAGSARGELSVINEIPVSADVDPQWCYGTDPAFIFVEGRSLYKANLQGEKILVSELSKPIDDLTLRCSLDGRTISFLSAQHEFAYIIENGDLSEYSLLDDFKKINVRYGSLMSPEGSAFVLGVDRLTRGIDILKQKKIYAFDSGEIFWTDKYIIHGSKNNSFVFENRQNAGSARADRAPEINFKRGVLLDNIERCGKDVYVTAFSDEADTQFAEMFTDEHPNSRTRLTSKKLIGRLNSGGKDCLLSVMFLDKYGWESADGLLLLADGSQKYFDLRWSGYRSDRFRLSKDSRFVLTYQMFWPRKELPGRVVVLQVIPPARLGGDFSARLQSLRILVSRKVSRCGGRVLASLFDGLEVQSSRIPNAEGSSAEQSSGAARRNGGSEFGSATLWIQNDIPV